MRYVLLRRSILCAALLGLSIHLPAQQPPDTFRWMDFHSPKDQDNIVWVVRALAVEKWTCIREIGVKYDAALVVTTYRATPQSLPDDDTFSVWTVSLTSHTHAPLITGVNLRLLDWQRFADGVVQDLTALYDNCRDCAPDTFFTAFYYDANSHAWASRWMRGGQGVPVWNSNHPAGPEWTQVYALMAEPDGHSELFTWNHFDYGKQKPPLDYIYRYDRDSFGGLDRTVEISEKEAPAVKLRLCRGQDTVEGLARGQDSPLCQQLVNPRPERHPVTTPPGNNRGHSAPPGTR
jgi:hypothetical protein